MADDKKKFSFDEDDKQPAKTADGFSFGDEAPDSEQARQGVTPLPGQQPMKPQVETEFEKARLSNEKGGGITTKGMGAAAGNVLKQQAVSTLSPSSIAKNAGLMTIDPLNVRSLPGAYDEAKAGWQRGHGIFGKVGEAVSSGLGSYVGMSGKSAAEHGERGEGGAILGEAAVPVAELAAGEAIGHAYSPLKQVGKESLVDTTGRPKPLARVVLGSDRAQALGEVLNPELADARVARQAKAEALSAGRTAPGPWRPGQKPMVPKPELGSPENPGWHSPLPKTMPKVAAVEPPLGSPENPGWHSKVPTRMPIVKPPEPELGTPENPGLMSKIPTGRGSMPKLPAIETSGVTGAAGAPPPEVMHFPEPRALQPGDKPGSMYSIPRDELTGAAQRGAPGAGDVLRNINKPIIYTPREGVGYPGPRTEPPPTLPPTVTAAHQPEVIRMGTGVGAEGPQRIGVGQVGELSDRALDDRRLEMRAQRLQQEIGRQERPPSNADQRINPLASGREPRAPRAGQSASREPMTKAEQLKAARDVAATKRTGRIF
jgi:hypothetical protein